MTDPAFREVEQHLDAWTLRLRLRDAFVWSLRGLGAGLAAGLVLAVIARLRPFLTESMLIGLAAGFGLAGFGLALALAYFWPRPRLLTARRFDRLFGLAERTSTALELAASPAGLAPDWLRRDQWADAAAASRRADPRPHLRFRLNLREGLASLAVSAALVAAIAIPNPQQAILAQQIAVDQAIAEQVEALEAIRAEIQTNPDLTDEQKDTLTQPLDDAIAQLQDGGLTQEQAVQILTEAQQQLQQQTDPDAQAAADALADAATALSQNPTTQAAGDALAAGDLDQAAQALSDIDLSQLSPEELQALATQLETAAGQLADTNPAIAAQLQAAADAIQAGDTAAAEAALEAAAAAVAQAGDAAQASDAAGEAAAQVAEAQDAVAQAGDGQGQGQGQGDGQGQGQGDGQGQGQGDGQGQGQGDGQGQGQGDGNGQGSGSGNGSGQGDGQGGTAGTDPIGQGNGAGDGGESTYEEIYSPTHLDGTDGTDVTLDGNGDPSGDVVGEGPTGPNDDGTVTVPYDQVYDGYTDTAYEAIDNGSYPLDLESVIRQYFTSLAP